MKHFLFNSTVVLMRPITIRESLKHSKLEHCLRTQTFYLFKLKLEIIKLYVFGTSN